MSDPVYQPPNTDPTLKGGRFREVPKHVVSTSKLLWFTFIPSVVLLIGGLASRSSIDFFAMTALASLVLAFIFSIFTAIELSKGKDPLAFVGYWILFVIAHAILLFVALFIGCGIAASGF